ncbi:phage tail assembly protein [Pantoea coffeiphila]|uniref:Phage tail protein n=1 Tax=Pantoea coffeiphila TaxID=1465635 RepID=A0A2S9I3L7_9GAMM|nr:phage tail assembly protein [Pantoea coffeiphila]PRD12365.1 phage tail protein [Pantoea coffeiphila]
MELKENVITLETPIKRGEIEITQVEVIKPTAGALRGVRLADLCSSDVDSLMVVLPRITVPSLTKAECLMLDPVDLIGLSGQVIGFLSPKSVE